MNKLTLATLGAAALLAAPAIAQTTTPNTTATTHPTKTMSQADLDKLQQKITGDLQKDGYTNIRVVPDSFLVHATNKAGDPVVMIINPDSVFAITDLPNAPNTAAHPNSGTTTPTTKP